MGRDELLERMRSTRQELEAVLAGLPPADLLEPGVAADWSVKDMLAHLAWYEREEAAYYGATGEPESPWWSEPQDIRNELMVAASRSSSLDHVLAELRAARQRMVALVESLTDDELGDPDRFPDTTTERPPWLAIATHTYLHDQEHLAMIRDWLARRS